MSSRVTGVEASIRAIGLARVLFRKSAEEAIQSMMREILRISQVYVPVETGALKKSGRIEWAGNRFGGTGFVAYGGSDDVYYALYVHEDITKQHAAPTSAKFLERAVAEARQSMSRLVRASMGSSVYATEAGRRLDKIA